MPPHTKIINRVAREVLKPVGVKQKGRSRVWLDDNGWWVSIIEFQPSAWSKGTYLNAGVNWQWYPKDNFSFDMGYREAGFVEYESDGQFEVNARQFAETAKEKVLEFRRNLRTPKAAKEIMETMSEEEKDTLWNRYHLGMIHTLTGSKDDAISNFSRVIEIEHDTEWARDLKGHAGEMLSNLKANKNHLAPILDKIHEARKLKNLDEVEIVFEGTA